MVPWPSMGEGVSRAFGENVLALSQEEAGGGGGRGVSEVLPLRGQEGVTTVPHLQALR